jgi:DNA-binding MarR family transcriptional regulator
MTIDVGELHDGDYAALADFRFALRQFQAFSDARAKETGLTPQQHQALLAIRGAEAGQSTIGYVAQRMMLKPHSTTGLIDRLETLGLVTRHVVPEDRRRAELRLTDKAGTLLATLSATHREEIRRLKPLLEGMLSRFD